MFGITKYKPNQSLVKVANNYLATFEKANSQKVNLPIISSKVDKEVKFAMSFNNKYDSKFKFIFNGFIPKYLPNVNIQTQRFNSFSIEKNCNDNSVLYYNSLILISATNLYYFNLLYKSVMFKLSFNNKERILYESNARSLYEHARLTKTILNKRYKDFDDFLYILPFEPFKGNKYQKEIRLKLLEIIATVKGDRNV